VERDVLGQVGVDRGGRVLERVEDDDLAVELAEKAIDAGAIRPSKTSSSTNPSGTSGAASSADASSAPPSMTSA
jgi:hypothetical protein